MRCHNFCSWHKLLETLLILYLNTLILSLPKCTSDTFEKTRWKKKLSFKSNKNTISFIFSPHYQHIYGPARLHCATTLSFAFHSHIKIFIVPLEYTCATTLPLFCLSFSYSNINIFMVSLNFTVLPHYLSSALHPLILISTYLQSHWDKPCYHPTYLLPCTPLF